MKLGALILVSVVLLAGCGGNSAGKSAGSAPTPSDTPAAATSSSAAPSPSPSATLLTLEAVASVACDGPYTVEKRSDLEWFASKGATCGNTAVSIFNSPGARDNWTSVAKTNNRVIVGLNWSVTPANDHVAQRVQAQLGGTVYGGF